jgi:hypothetical protein
MKVGLGVLLAATCWAAPAVAAPRDGCEVEGVYCGPVVAERLAREPSRYFDVGLGLEGWNSEFSGSDYLVALGTALRISAFAPHLELMMKPGTGTENYENTRLLFGGGLRAYLPWLDHRLSYGVGVLTELRLEDHFWLAYATPLELGGVLYRRRSLELELFAGVRRAFAGELINSFLVDPNGFHDERAEAELERAKGADAWHGFVRLVISRRID